MEIIIDAIDTTSFKCCLVYRFHFLHSIRYTFFSHISQCSNLLVFKSICLCNSILCFIATVREERLYFVLCKFVWCFDCICYEWFSLLIGTRNTTNCLIYSLFCLSSYTFHECLSTSSEFVCHCSICIFSSFHTALSTFQNCRDTFFK